MSPTLLHRTSGSRGHADHGWLKTFHTFAFADWWSPKPREQSWGPLRVLNEDRVSPRNGFPPHPHRELEIFSLIVDGTISHQDSMGNTEKLGRGEIQMTSAGTGIRHGEGNGGKGGEELHFLQCWAKPHTPGLKHSYYTRSFSDDEKRGKLLHIVAEASDPAVTDSRLGTGPTPIHSNLSVYTSILPPTSNLSHTFNRPKGYVHLVMRKQGYRYPGADLRGQGPRVKIIVGEQQVVLEEGDGAYLDQVQGAEVSFESVGDDEAEFIVFDLADE